MVSTIIPDYSIQSSPPSGALNSFITDYFTFSSRIHKSAWAQNGTTVLPVKKHEHPPKFLSFILTIYFKSTTGN